MTTIKIVTLFHTPLFTAILLFSLIVLDEELGLVGTPFTGSLEEAL